MTIQNKRIFASILFVSISFVCVAQGVEPPPPGPPIPQGTPIDGGLFAGICFALFYGAKKLLKRK